MLTLVSKPWAGVSREWKLFRTDEQLDQGIFTAQVSQVMPAPGVITIVALAAFESPLLAKHVANRVAHIAAVDGSSEWRALDKVITGTMDRLAAAHGLGASQRHHVSSAHSSGRLHAHPSHVPEDLFAEYLLTGRMPLHDSGGQIRVDDGRRKYVAYAQPDHQSESRDTLSQFQARFVSAAGSLLDTLEGKILVA